MANSWVNAVGAVALGVAVSACGAPEAEFTNTLGNESRCTTVDAPMTPVNPSSAEEPPVRIVQLPGWEAAEPVDTQRIALVDKNLTHDGFAATATVTIAAAKAGGGPPGAASSMAEKLLDTEQNHLVAMQAVDGGATDLVVTRRTVCGYPAQTIGYAARSKPPAVPERTVTQLTTVAQTGATEYFVVKLTLETTDPTNPAYQRDSQTMLDGFQVLPPT